ncbi:MAG TPA: FecR domain-containing protein [Rhizomicrobium sp.]|nr:FecR domain-containing protein [Rhizomicrobium sp.]
MNGIDATAARFLERRDLGPWGEADQAELDAWLNESAAHCAAFWRLEAVWSDAERLSVLRSFRPQTAKSEPRRDIWPILRRAAAATVAIAAIGAASAFYLLQPEGERYSTPMGGREVITLFDGSQVELNTDTSVRIAPARRMAWVEKGEAYFQIKHDAAHPFVVQVGDHRIVDLGTKFVVRDEPGRLEVSLVEGKARVEPLNNASKPAVLTPGDVAVATAADISVTRKTEKHLASELGWRRGVLIFDYTTLGQAVAEFNRYNAKKIVLAPNAPAHLTMVGTFPINDVELFGRVATLVLKVHVADEGDKIVISR